MSNYEVVESYQEVVASSSSISLSRARNNIIGVIELEEEALNDTQKMCGRNPQTAHALQ